MKIPRIPSLVKILIILLPALIIQACTTQYYGYTKEEWNRMTRFEQEKAKVEWRDVIAAKEKGTLGDSRAEISEGFVDYSKSTDSDSKNKE